MKYTDNNDTLTYIGVGLFLIIAVLLIVPKVVNARDITITYVPPVEYMDDTPILAGDLKEFKFYCNAQDPAGVMLGTAPGDSSSAVMSVPDEKCDMQVVAVTQLDYESGYSNTWTIPSIMSLTPKPPTIIDLIIAWFKSIFRWFA